MERSFVHGFDIPLPDHINQIGELNKSNQATLFNNIIGLPTGITHGLVPSITNSGLTLVLSAGSFCSGGVFYELIEDQGIDISSIPVSGTYYLKGFPNATQDTNYQYREFIDDLIVRTTVTSGVYKDIVDQVGLIISSSSGVTGTQFGICQFTVSGGLYQSINSGASFRASGVNSIIGMVFDGLYPTTGAVYTSTGSVNSQLSTQTGTQVTQINYLSGKVDELTTMLAGRYDVISGTNGTAGPSIADGTVTADAVIADIVVDSMSGLVFCTITCDYEMSFGDYLGVYIKDQTFSSFSTSGSANFEEGTNNGTCEGLLSQTFVYSLNGSGRTFRFGYQIDRSANFGGPSSASLSFTYSVVIVKV